MNTPQHPAEPPLNDAPVRLLRVARLLYSAAAAAEQVNVNRPVDQGLDDQLIEFEVKTVLWEAVTLLPPSLRLDSGGPSDHQAGDRGVGLQLTLREAAEELHRGPLASVPAGASTLLADLTALIARLDSSTRVQSDGRELQ